MKNSKLQIAMLTEATSAKIPSHTARIFFGAWSLRFLWSLVFGIWCFNSIAQETPASTNSAPPSTTVRRGPSAESLLVRNDDWFRSEAGRRAISNVLSWQAETGGWPSNTRTPAQRFDGERSRLRSSFDNGATTPELRLLAKALRATGDTNCESAFLKGLDLILKAQYPTGGWPQSYPPDDQYHRHITFNDGAMVRVMNFLRDAASLPEFDFVDAQRKEAVRKAFADGVECILKCQIKVDGKLTVWCAQHDELDYRPRSGRKFELVSLSGSESAGILELLMKIEKPDKRIAGAIHGGARWFESAKITGIRIERPDRDRVVVPDTNAPPLWARFYEIETSRPIFSGRDSVKKYSLAEIELERRRGYEWYGPWGERVAAAYAEWKRKWPEL